MARYIYKNYSFSKSVGLIICPLIMKFMNIYIIKLSYLIFCFCSGIYIACVNNNSFVHIFEFVIMVLMNFERVTICIG